MSVSQSFIESPRICVLLPVFRTEPEYLRLAIRSVLQQTLTDWQLVIVDDGSQDPRLDEVLAWAAADARTDIVTQPNNSGISRASNEGLARVRAPLLALLDHDDVLEPQALSQMVAAADRDPSAEMLYSDRDAVSSQGVPTEVFLKPDWSPERLRNNMYIAHLTVFRTNAVREIGGFDPAFDGAQDHDLALRISERGKGAIHVAQVLYHWRQLPQSTAKDPSAKPYAAERGRAAVQAHLERTGYRGNVAHSPYAGTYSIEREPRACLTSIVIPTRGGRRKINGAERVLAVEAVRSIAARTYCVEYEIIVVHDADADGGYLEDIAAILGARLRVVEYVGKFNFSAKVNRGVEAARGEVVVLLNDDVQIISPRWLDQLVALAQYPDVGAVGAKLLFEDGKVQHAGHVFGYGQVGHVAQGLPEGPGPFAENAIDREVVGVTAACLAQRRDVWLSVGGLDETLPNSFNDVDYCWRIREAGFRIVQANTVRLFHFESQTRNPTVESWEAGRILARLGDALNNDPFTRSISQSRSMSEWLRVSRDVLRNEGVASFRAKARRRLERQRGSD
jgi:GT2 family glycosyltransferase